MVIGAAILLGIALVIIAVLFFLFMLSGVLLPYIIGPNPIGEDELATKK